MCFLYICLYAESSLIRTAHPSFWILITHDCSAPVLQKFGGFFLQLKISIALSKLVYLFQTINKFCYE